MHIQNFDPYEFSKKEISGVPVYYKKLPWAPCIHVRVVFKTGAFDDPKGKEGLSHFLEHMFFNGSPTLPDKKAIRQWEKANTLNSSNASTWYWYTMYTAKCLPEKFTEVMRGAKDLLFNPLIRPEDVEHERKVITQEAWGRYKNEKLLSYMREILHNNFNGHIHEKVARALGWPETIQAISHEDIKNWHATRFVKENMFVVLAGAIDETDLENMNDLFSNLPSGAIQKENYGSISKPLVQRITKTADEIGITQEQVSFSISRADNPMDWSLQAVTNQSFRLLRDLLHERIRLENGLCYSIAASASPNKDFFTADISVKTSQEHLEKVEAETWNIIHEIIDGKHAVRFEEIHQLALDQLKSSEYLSGEIADEIWNDLLHTGKIETLTDTLKKAELVTYNDVQQHLKNIFNPEYTFTEIILPSKK